MYINNIELKHGLTLAPMAGVTDISFRALAREYGAELTVSEMVSAKGVYYKDKKTASLAASGPEETPFALQLFGSEPEIMSYAASKLREINPGISVIDINMGCPMPKITGNGDGCALMKDPGLAARIVRALSDNCGLPVTVKIRTGWDAESINAPYLAALCEANGAKAICVHGRTRDQLYRPPVDRKTIRQVKRAVSIPVIANGGIYSASDAVEMLEETGCDGIAIGQGALGRPWIFREILCALEGKPYTPPNTEEILKTAARHVRMLCADKGEFIGTREARKHLGWYIKGLPGAAEARNKINQASSVTSLIEILQTLSDGYIL